MKVIMIAVCSANGKLTRGEDGDIYNWTSKEDQDFFFDQIKKTKLIVMGSRTYEVIRKNLKLEKGKLRIVLTNEGEKYRNEEVKGRLEFSSETPREIYKRCMIDHTSMLLVGGSKIYSSFLKNGLIDEIYLTIEPVVFGEGKES